MGLDITLEKVQRKNHKKKGMKTNTVIFNSAKYPNHLFKIGYFRSSANELGINNVLEERGLENLYDILNPFYEYFFQPNWEQAKIKCTNLIKKYNTIDKYSEYLEIVLETIDYVLAQPDREKYYLSWVN